MATVFCSLNSAFRASSKIVPPDISYLLPNLTLHLKGDATDVSGTSLMNYATNLFDCTLSRSSTSFAFPTIASGQIVGTGCLSFSNATRSNQAGYVQVPSQTFGASDTGVSFCFWIKSTTFVQNMRVMGFSTAFPDNGVGGVECVCMSSTIAMNINGGFYNGSVSVKGGWNHVAIVLRKADNKLLIFYNGSNTPDSFTITTYPSSTTRTFCYIGKSTWSGSDPTFDGALDDIRVYNTALTFDDISRIFKQR